MKKEKEKEYLEKNLIRQVELEVVAGRARFEFDKANLMVEMKDEHNKETRAKMQLQIDAKKRKVEEHEEFLAFLYERLSKL